MVEQGKEQRGVTVDGAGLRAGAVGRPTEQEQADTVIKKNMQAQRSGLLDWYIYPRRPVRSTLTNFSSDHMTPTATIAHMQAALCS